MSDADQTKKVADALAGMTSGSPTNDPPPQADVQNRPAQPAPSASQPARTIRPSRPGAPLRPAMPPPVAKARAKTDSADPFSRIVEDANVTIGVTLYSAPSAVTTSSKPAVRREPFFRALGFRRTIIPILLTLGVALPGLAIWYFTMDQDAPLKQLGLAFPISLLSIGAIMLLLAIVNMVAVRQQAQTASR
jgi:hypothetical protein